MQSSTAAASSTFFPASNAIDSSSSTYSNTAPQLRPFLALQNTLFSGVIQSIRIEGFGALPSDLEVRSSGTLSLPDALTCCLLCNTYMCAVSTRFL
jgi:hypothetical protein